MSEARRFDRMSTAALAVLLAFLFWYVRNDTQRPMNDINLRPPDDGYTVQFDNLAPGWDAYVDEGTDVVLTVRGIGDRFDTVIAEDLAVYVDCADVDPATGPVMLPVSWRWGEQRGWGDRRPTGARVIEATPGRLLVRFDPIISDTRRVSLRANGSLEQNMVLEREEITPDEVLLQGPARRLAEVDRVVAVLPDAERAVASTRFFTDVLVLALNRAGTPVPQVTAEPPRVDALARFSPTGVRLPVLVPPPEGRVPDGYWLRGREIDPREVTVYGPREQLSELVAEGVVNAEIFDVTGMTTTQQVRVPLALPTGLQVEGLPESQITVTVLVEALPGRREFALDVVVNSLPNGLTATVSPQRVLVALTGPQPALEALRATGLSARVDVAGLAVGSHRLSIQVSVPEDLGVTVEAITPDQVEVVLAGALRGTQIDESPGEGEASSDLLNGLAGDRGTGTPGSVLPIARRTATPSSTPTALSGPRSLP
jgi:hypothetical protein